MANLPPHQKSLIYNTTTSTLSLTTTSPPPSPTSAAEHTIKVHSTAITNGELTWGAFVPWPTLHIPCYDVSGTIHTPAPNTPFTAGQKVYGRIDAAREGAAREYATLLASETALVPEGLGMEEAASVPMSALTAWQALFEHGLLTGDEYTATSVPHVNPATGVVVGGGQAKGKRVLVLGASGGVGLMAVQFAKLAGASFVAGTASSANRSLVESRGADEVIDYKTVTMEEWVGGGGGDDEGKEKKKFDLVFDCAGGKSMLDGWNAVKRDGGVYVSVVPGFREPEGGKPPGVTSKWFVMVSRGSELEAISRFVEKGLVKGCVDSVWKMEEYEEAFAKTASGHARGKVVIKVAED
ncbi:NAD(P)-binding protein [Periconia macrospinosa]|uniref:NAD(P)-binding protein n=1 Tax=Periconia macrospinosa TaxID=97972 RepID=A0A2V1D208_9PLEO|nr:NAD(P)-binding protein [Periconia macrospinosa]